MLTSYNMNIIGCYSDGISPRAVVIEILNNLGQAIEIVQFYAPNEINDFYYRKNILDQSSKQISLDATRTYTIQNIGAALPGLCEFRYYWDWIAGS